MQPVEHENTTAEGLELKRGDDGDDKGNSDVSGSMNKTLPFIICLIM